mgnify:CR=1 FL=1
MIQRVQTLFLLLVIIAGIVLMFLPLAVYYSEMGYYLKFFIYGMKNLAHDPFGDEIPKLFSLFFGLPLLLVQVIIILLAGFTIFKYKRRPMQLRLNQLNIFLHVILVGGIFYFSTLIEAKVAAAPVYGVGVVFPLVSIVALFLSSNFIRKDERLVRSADRLR